MYQVHTGAYVSLLSYILLLAPGKTDYTTCHPGKTITHTILSTHNYTYARQTQVNSRKEIKERKEKKGRNKTKKAQKKRKERKDMKSKKRQDNKGKQGKKKRKNVFLLIAVPRNCLKTALYHCAHRASTAPGRERQKG